MIRGLLDKTGSYLAIAALRWLMLALLVGFTLGCGEGGGGANGATAPEDFRAQEEQVRANYDAQRIALEGSVLTEAGRPVAGATLHLGQAQAHTDPNGRLEFIVAPRRNALLQVDAPGFRREIMPVHLHRSLAITRVSLDPIALSAEDSSVVRFMFGGDISLGRRFLDPLEITPRDQIPVDNPEALIQASNPEPGSRAAVQYLHPMFDAVDYPIVNLETPVLNHPATPYPDKDFAFFTLPGSLPAIKALGIDYVSLGNNHVYDYLDSGVTQTLANLSAVGIANSGAGLNSESAFTAYRTVLGGTPYAFLSMTSVSGSETSISYVATDSKGGAADLREDSLVTGAIQRERNAGFYPIVQLHTGKEYTFEPTDYAAGRMALAAESGAALVIAHHPHVAQGFELINGVLVANSLGNLVFDQERLETMLGVLARVDMAQGQVRSARVLPVYLEDFRPRFIGGRLAGNLLRRVGEFSHGVLVYPYNGQGWIALNSADAVPVDRTIELDVTVPAFGTAVLDLRDVAGDHESLLSGKIEVTGASIQPGRDLMLHGDFEDWDVDEDALELARWDVTGDSRFACRLGAYRGSAGLCSLRKADDMTDSITPFRNSIRVMGDAVDMPNKDLSLLGYMRGKNAGGLSIIARYAASEGDLTFGEEVAFSHPSGSYDWQAIVANLHMPPDDPAKVGDPSANPRAVRLFLHQSPPPQGNGLISLDELAVINWEENLDASAGFTLPRRMRGIS